MSDSGWVVDLFVTLTGTSVGVGLAFLLEYHQRERRAKSAYGDALNSIRADLANLGVICRHAAANIGTNQVRAALLSMEAPALDAALISPAFLERAPYGLRTCLITLATSRRAIQNILSQPPLPPPAELKPMIDQLRRVIEYLGKVLDEEVKPLGRPILRTSRDKEVIAGLTAAMRGEEGNATSAGGTDMTNSTSAVHPDRNILFSNESFVIGMLQAVAGGVVVASLAQTQALGSLAGAIPLLVLLTGALIALSLALVAAYLKHEYKMWDVKQNPEKANGALTWMRHCMFLALIFLLGSIGQLIALSWWRVLRG
ncbi:MAG: hypothetical protein GDA67_01790 [Nitrospira sp. CR1.3]|nr:hypothetical protein [Nitrospira sp. CR1.3]